MEIGEIGKGRTKNVIIFSIGIGVIIKNFMVGVIKIFKGVATTNRKTSIPKNGGRKRDDRHCSKINFN